MYILLAVIAGLTDVIGSLFVLHRRFNFMVILVLLLVAATALGLRLVE